MADKKISALNAANLPLAGTEVLPLVQSGATKNVATNDLTVKNVRSNATTGLLQVTGPGTGATRVMTTPDANFTAARTDAAQSFTGDQTIAGSALPQNIIPTSAPSAKWAIDGTNAGLLITIADTATYDLAVGSGVVYLWDNGGNGVGISYTFYGTAALQYNPSALYSNTGGTAAKVNFFYNAGTNTYRLENLTGSSKNIYIFTIKLRAAS
jgi:hypothetical protein